MNNLYVNVYTKHYIIQVRVWIQLRAMGLKRINNKNLYHFNIA